MKLTDFFVLFGLELAVTIFVFYEFGGLTLDGWHSISYIAQEHRWLEALIIAAFPIAGIALGIWFFFHIKRGIVRIYRSLTR